MTPIVQGVWMKASHPGKEVMSDAMRSLEITDGVVQTALYDVVEPPAPLTEMATNVGRLDVHVTPVANALALIEFSSLRACVAAEQAVRARTEGQLGEAAIALKAIFAKVSSVSGEQNRSYDRFAPVIQLGQFNMPTLELEFGLAEWYEVHRLEPFTHLVGGVRAHRFASICGPTKFGILYEYASVEAHLSFLDSLETRAHDPNDVMGGIVPRTIHLPISPTIGHRCSRA